MSSYKLNVVNDSGDGPPTFALMTTLPGTDALSVACLADTAGRPGEYTFTWDEVWAFTWSNTMVADGGRWTQDARLPADPGSSSTSAAKFDYQDGQFRLSYAPHTPSQGKDTLWIEADASIPPPSVQPSSLGVVLGENLVTVVNSGPDLEHVFPLHPVYYIAAGDFVQGQMIDVDLLTLGQRFEYHEGVTVLDARLDDQYRWRISAPATTSL